MKIKIISVISAGAYVADAVCDPGYHFSLDAYTYVPD
jgi:hypothetical protein